LALDKNCSSSSTNGDGGDPETLAWAAQISLDFSLWKQEQLKLCPSKSSEKRQILDGETLTRATQSDAEREPV